MVAGMVSHFTSLTHPRYSSPLEPHHRKHGGTHTLREEGVLLHKINDVEAKSLPARHVAHAEKEPLVIAASVYVILQNQVELPRFLLVDPKEITRIKIRAELHATSAARLSALRRQI